MADESKKRSFKRMKFELAPQDEVAAFQYELDQILQALGHPEALITDLSSVRDFADDRDELELIGNAFGIEALKPEELLIEVARRVRNARKG